MPTDTRRLFPSLLDRLTDREPSKVLETSAAHTVTEQALRRLVRRDLTWLFNTTNLGERLDSTRHPESSRSVLNFGIPDLTGHTLGSVDVTQLERSVCEALLRFEPRLHAESLRVSVLKGTSRAGSPALLFDIQGELWATPLPLGLHLRTEVDLESGRVAIEELHEP
jgi:type VI secretion system protein ImpF